LRRSGGLRFEKMSTSQKKGKRFLHRGTRLVTRTGRSSQVLKLGMFPEKRTSGIHALRAGVGDKNNNRFGEP